jgi:hypothetical protein
MVRRSPRLRCWLDVFDDDMLSRVLGELAIEVMSPTSLPTDDVHPHPVAFELVGDLEACCALAITCRRICAALCVSTYHKLLGDVESTLKAGSVSRAALRTELNAQERIVADLATDTLDPDNVARFTESCASIVSRTHAEQARADGILATLQTMRGVALSAPCDTCMRAMPFCVQVGRGRRATEIQWRRGEERRSFLVLSALRLQAMRVVVLCKRALLFTTQAQSQLKLVVEEAGAELRGAHALWEERHEWGG